MKKVKELNKIAVVYGYIIAYEARNKDGLHDCNDKDHPGEKFMNIFSFFINIYFLNEFK